MHYLPYIILFTPLIAAVLNTLIFKESKKLAVLLSIAACGISLIAALAFFFSPADATFASLEWLKVGSLKITIGAVSDPLARGMLLVVTGVGFFIHLFAVGYMSEDPGIARFFAKLSLFMFSMLGIVLADNLVMMFIFWELVGLSSYLLIGFWFQRPSAAEASKKAFLVNRIGDFGFMLGILAVWQLWGAVNFTDLKTLVAQNSAVGFLIHFAALGLFCGCVGKSAQFPLHVWLPDAMEGPTPVSALIHAATMVAAGVYMLCRVSFILSLSPIAMNTIAWVGGFTAIFAAVIAVQQNDIKRILAYSTLSQLGYMVMAVGLAAYSAAMFHLTTHACFKALLFLGAGSIIHSIHHEQDIWKMGGLWGKMKVTSVTFIVATAALAGVPFLSGFFSKEAILGAAFEHNKVLFVIGIITACLTTFYMCRLCFITFFGKARSEHSEHAHESPLIMTLPLVVLAIASVVVGYLNIRGYLDGIQPEHEHGAGIVMVLSLVALLVGFSLAWVLYRKAEKDPLHMKILANKFYIDEIYLGVFVKLQDIAAAISSWIDRWIIEGIIRVGCFTGVAGGEVLRLVQGGNLKAYVVLFFLGVLFFLWFLLKGGNIL